MRSSPLNLLPSLLLGSLLSLVGLAASVSGMERPNFVWILSEDNSYHYLKPFCKTGAETPRIEAMAKEGVLFEHAFSNAPVCSVARTTLMTSCYAPRIGTLHHRKTFQVPMPEGLEMFPAYLRKAGYYTTNNAKEDYNATKGRNVWNDSSRTASWRNREDGQPFFHMQTFTTTHESSLHFPEGDIHNKPTKTDPQSVTIAPYHPDTKTFRYTVARYHDRIREVDAQVGQLIDNLKKDGLLENTFVFYFGDHGGVLPRGKGYAYDTGLHVPLVIRVPEKWRDRIEPQVGARLERFVSFIDFGPTVLNLAGLEVPPQVDGRPFLGSGSDEMADNRESIGHADRFDEKYDMVRTLRRGKYRYVRNFQPFNFDGLMNNYRYKMAAYRDWRRAYDAGELNEVQRQFFEARPVEMLFDVEADPYETNNLANVPEMQAELHALRSRLNAILREMPDLGFYPEPHLAAHAAPNPVQFGQKHQAEIAELLEVANLALLPFDEAEPRLREALRSPQPWHRYWGVVACSSHGKAAAPLVKEIQEIAASDVQPLVRTRGAEYLALYQGVDPRPTIAKALHMATTATEANLILNTVVLLQDGTPQIDFVISPDDVQHVSGGREELGRRLDYLSGKN